MGDRNARPDLLAGLLPTVLQRVDPDRQLRAYAVWTCWDEVVGDAIAKRAQPARFRNGILFVTVASHTWMQELQFMKDDIRARLNARVSEDGPPVIRDIFFVSGAVEPRTLVTTVGTPIRVSERRDLPLPVLPSSGDTNFDAALTRIQRARARRRMPE